MMLKILQISTVIIFVIFSMSGILVFLFFPNKLDDFGKLINMIFPIFIAEVIPALIGKPLTEAVRQFNKNDRRIPVEDLDDCK